MNSESHSKRPGESTYNRSPQADGMEGNHGNPGNYSARGDEDGSGRSADIPGPDFTIPWDYDEDRWGGSNREATRGGLPTISVCRVHTLRLLAPGPQAVDSLVAAVTLTIAHDLALDAEALTQHTRTGHNRLELRIRWAIASLRRLGYIALAHRAGTPHIYMLTELGAAMLARDPGRINERGTGMIRSKEPTQ